MKFSDALSMMLERKGMKQSDLCRASGLGTGHLSMFVTGKREPTLSSLIAIADAFECSLDDLVGRRVPGNLATVDISDLSKEQQAAVKTVVDSMRK